jgi:hypothetical protein
MTFHCYFFTQTMNSIQRHLSASSSSFHKQTSHTDATTSSSRVSNGVKNSNVRQSTSFSLSHWFHQFHHHHERIKKFVHEGMRYPLPKWGRFIMGCFYFSVPVIGGWYIMQWAIHQSHQSIGVHGELLPQKQIQGYGDKTMDHDGNEHKIGGATGWGGGVRLVVSDVETQERNREMLNKFLRHQQRKYNTKNDTKL